MRMDSDCVPLGNIVSPNSNYEIELANNNFDDFVNFVDGSNLERNLAASYVAGYVKKSVLHVKKLFTFKLLF